MGPARLVLVSVLAALLVILFALPFSGALATPSGAGQLLYLDLSIADASADEGAGSVSLTVRLSGTSTSDVTVSYATADATAAATNAVNVAAADGTAVAPGDYNATSGTVTISAGGTTTTIAVTIVDDAIDEPDETFTVTLSSPSGAAISSIGGTATVTILDNDPLPVLSIADASVAENAGSVSLTISLNAVSGRDVSVQYATADGTAKAGSDYSGVASTTATIAAGTTSKTVSFTILDDAVYEGNEAFFVNLSDAVWATINDGSATVTIVDDELPPGVISYNSTVDVQLNADGIDVTWTSAAGEEGHVEWALSTTDLSGKTGTYTTTTDTRTAIGGTAFANFLNKKAHRVRITGVTGGSTIYYNIVSGGVADSSGPYQVTIPSSALTSPALFLSGTVTYDEGSAGQECLVRMRVTQKKSVDFGPPVGIISSLEHSLWGNALTDGNGGYILDITNIRQDPGNTFDKDFDQALSYDASSTDATITAAARCDNVTQGRRGSTTGAADKTASGYPNYDITVAREVTFEIPMVVGFNLIAMPVIFGTTITAPDLAGLIAAQNGTVASIQRWGVGGSQTFDGWVADLPGTNPFEIEAGRGYFVKLSAAPDGGVFSVTGAPFALPATLDFVVGFNLIGVPFMTPSAGYTAKSLAEKIDPSGLAQGGVVASIQRWGVGGSQTFDGWVSDLEDTNSFTIEVIAGYFTKLTQVVTGVEP